MSILASVLFLACLPAALLDHAMPRWQNEKGMRIDDAYKWIYQATRGGEHAAPSREAAASWLERELATMGEAPVVEREWIPLCPAGEIGRVYLRPFRARGGKPDDLVNAFLASARQYRSEPKAFTDAWMELGKRLKQKGFGAITHKEWLRLDAEMKKKHYPAVHHSDEYNRENRPAYRVITLEQAQILIPS